MKGDREDPTAPSVPYRVVDAFSRGPFSGNPAAVMLPSKDPAHLRLLADDVLMQQVAGEMNLSETAFPHPPDQTGVRTLRWFTPTAEVTLCGHATMAAAHALLEDGARPPLRFSSASGPLTVEREEEGALRLDFPADPPSDASVPQGLHAALGLAADTPFLTGERCAVVPVASAEDVRKVEPDMASLAGVRLPPGVMGVSVTAPGHGGEAGGETVHFVSRFFGPWVGVPEDPVTGMAHTVLGPYWSRRLGLDEMEARQLSRRGGALTVRVRRDRVHLVGRAVTMARGEFLLPER